LGKMKKKVNLGILRVDSQDLKGLPHHAWTHNPFAINFVGNVWTSNFEFLKFVSVYLISFKLNIINYF